MAADSVATGYVTLIPQMTGVKSAVSKGIDGTGRAIEGKGRGIGSKLMSGIGKAAKIGAVGVGIAAGATFVGGFKSAVDQQNAKKVLGGLYGSAKQAAQMMSDLRAVSKKSPIDYSAYLKASQSLAYAGVKGKDAVGILKNVGLAITAAGGSSENMGRATDAILKMVNAGKVSLDSLQQLSNSGVPIISGLAKHFGVSMDKINSMASEGKIGLEDVTSVMQNATGKTFKTMVKAGEAASKSFGNQWKIAKDNVLSAVGKAMIPMLNRLAPVIGKAGNAIAGFATKAGKWLNGLNFSSWDGFIESLKLGPAFDSIMGSLNTLKPAFKQFISLLPTLGAAGGKLASAGLKLLVKGLKFLADHVDTIIKYMPLLVGAFVAWKIAQRGVMALQSLSAPLMVAANVLRFRAASAELKLAAATRTNTAATATNTGAHKAGLLARGRAAIATGLLKVKTVAMTVAQKAAAVGQRALNLAMRMNPIGIIITALTALVAGLVWFFTKTKVGKKIIEVVWGAIKKAIGAAVGFIKKHFRTLLLFLGPAGWIAAGVIALAKNWKAVWGGIKKVIGAVWDWIKKWVLTPIKKYFTVIIPKALRIYGKIFSTIWEGIKVAVRAVYNWIRDHVFKPLGRFFTKIIPAALGILRDRVSDAWRKIKSLIRGPYEWIKKHVFRPLAHFITKTIPNAFGKGVSAVKSIWGKIADIAKKPIKFVVNTVLNHGLIKAFNSVTDFLGLDSLHINPIRLPKGFRDGGYTGRKPVGAVTGVVHGDEFVVQSKSRSRFESRNPGALEHLNRTGSLPGYRDGGRVVNPLKHMQLTQGYNPVHMGVDLAAPVGTPVFATGPGRVNFAGPGAHLPGIWGGNEIHIEGGGIERWFAHLSRIGVHRGEMVNPGEQIGLSGNTGFTSGPHLHFGTFRGGYPNSFNPLSYLSGAVKPSGGKGGGGGGFWSAVGDFISNINPVNWVVDKITDTVSGLINKIPGAGSVLDLAMGAAKKLFDVGKTWVIHTAKDVMGIGYAGGTRHATPGYHWVGERGPELVRFKGGEQVMPHRDSIRAASSAGSRRGTASDDRPIQVNLPESVILRVGDREFTAYVDERASVVVSGSARKARVSR